MRWLLYALLAALSVIDIGLVFAGGIAWFGSGTLGLLGAAVVTLLGPALVYSSASGSARGDRLGMTTPEVGPSYAIGITISTLAAATAAWHAVTGPGTPTVAKVIAAIVALLLCAGLAAAPGALRLQVQRLGLEGQES